LYPPLRPPAPFGIRRAIRAAAVRVDIAVLGAIGYSGGTGSQDEVVSKAGVATIK
jgi:hypothetical protein